MSKIKEGKAQIIRKGNLIVIVDKDGKTFLTGDYAFIEITSGVYKNLEEN